MPKQTFSPHGVDLKVAEFYALSDTNLLLVAKSFAGDLQTAMDDHFTFTSDQGIYLAGMSSAAAFIIGSQIAAVLAIRGTITMAVVPVQGSAPKRPKELKATMSGYVAYADGSSSYLTGTLSLTITWTLL